MTDERRRNRLKYRSTLQREAPQDNSVNPSSVGFGDLAEKVSQNQNRSPRNTADFKKKVQTTRRNLDSLSKEQIIRFKKLKAKGSNQFKKSQKVSNVRVKFNKSKKASIAVAVGSLVIIIGSTLLILNNENGDGTPSTDGNPAEQVAGTNIEGQGQSNPVDFNYLVPLDGLNDEDAGPFIDDKIGTVVYKDVSNIGEFTISQQELPEQFKSNNDGLKNLSLSLDDKQTVQQISTSYGVGYVIEQEDNMQRALFSDEPNNLLVFITTEVPLSLDEWINYIELLQLKGSP